MHGPCPHRPWSVIRDDGSTGEGDNTPKKEIGKARDMEVTRDE